MIILRKSRLNRQRCLKGSEKVAAEAGRGRKRNAEKATAQKDIESELASTTTTLNPWKVPVPKPVAIIPVEGNNNKTGSASMGIDESASPFAIYSGNNETNQKLAKANKTNGSEVLRNNKTRSQLLQLVFQDNQLQAV